MAAEPQIITNGPLRPMAEVRAENGFGWWCRRGHLENGEIHEISGGDRREYQRHMRGHGAKPLKTAYEPWRPWKPPRPADAYAPKPADPGQRVEWVQATEGHWRDDCDPDAPGTSVRADGQHTTRTGLIWSVATAPSEFWVQPDDDPTHPVLVKRAGKRDRGHNEGELYEIPGAAEAAAARIRRAEIIRKRGIFPVIDRVETWSYRDSRTAEKVIVWHSDPGCPRAAGKAAGDGDGRDAGHASSWTPMRVADVVLAGQGADRSLCPDCIVNLDASPRRTSEEPVTASPAAEAADSISGASPAPAPEHGALPPPGRAYPGKTPTRTRFSVTLEPPRADGEFLDSCLWLGNVLTVLAGQVGDWAGQLADLNLPRPVLDALRQAAGSITGAAGGTAQAAKAFEGEFEDARDVAARGMHITGQDCA